jgi:hypothetical protein
MIRLQQTLISQSQQIALHSAHVYEVRPRRDKRGFDLISDVLPFDRWWYAERTPSRTLSAMPNTAAAHMML